jgi:hypothetical protein
VALSAYSTVGPNAPLIGNHPPQRPDRASSMLHGPDEHANRPRDTQQAEGRRTQPHPFNVNAPSSIGSCRPDAGVSTLILQLHGHGRQTHKHQGAVATRWRLNGDNGRGCGGVISIPPIDQGSDLRSVRYQCEMVPSSEDHHLTPRRTGWSRARPRSRCPRSLPVPGRDGWPLHLRRLAREERS